MLNKTRSTRKQIDDRKERSGGAFMTFHFSLSFLNYFDLPNMTAAHRMPKQW
jgi:hypothetical protein